MMVLFEVLRDGQAEAHGQLLQICSRLHQLAPPHLTSQVVSGWIQEAQQWGAAWQQRLQNHLLGLQQHEQSLQQKVGAVSFASEWLTSHQTSKAVVLSLSLHL